MTTTELDTLTDYFAKTDPTMFPITEKLSYYNIAYGLLYAMIIDEQEGNYELEPTPIDTVANTGNYQIALRAHFLNWVKMNYGDGFIPARYKSQEDLIAEYGHDLETTLSQWPTSDPIYWFEGTGTGTPPGEINIIPKPTAAQAGAGRLKYSIDYLPDDMTIGSTPNLLQNFHFLLALYAAFMYHDNNGEDAQATKRETQFEKGAARMMKAMFPRARQKDQQAHVPDDDGSNY